MIAHQRVIRNEQARLNPRSLLSLEGASVEPVSRKWASQIILKYEWLGTMNKAIACYGLISKTGEPMGVACFGYPQGTASLKVCGDEWADKTIALERGACVHYAHPHAASFLISRAVAAISADHGFNVVIAYSDAEAGEIGTVYQATNWVYLGVAPGRASKYRWKATRLADGKTFTSRQLRAMGIKGKQGWDELRANPEWKLEKDFGKGKYVTFSGDKRTKRDARRALRYEPVAYPKRPT